jgi:GTP-binding protein Era
MMMTDAGGGRRSPVGKRDVVEPELRSGFGAIIGRPNVGKSTILNRMVGKKIAITADKPQTTRNRILGVVAGPGYQLVLIDTPGIHKPHHLLGEHMVRTARAAMEEVEAVLMVVEAHEPPGPGDRYVAAYVREAKTPAFCVLNKIDLVGPAEVDVAARRYGELAEFRTVIPISAVNGEGLDRLLKAIVDVLPGGPQYFPDGMVSDQPERLIISEVVREKIIGLTEEEIPHSVAVEVQEMTARAGGTLYVRCQIYVERQSQRGIIIGAGGSMLRQVGTAARAELEALLGTKIFLDLWVKVNPGWRNRERALRELGYH